jgi:hypothetical protein
VPFDGSRPLTDAVAGGIVLVERVVERGGVGFGTQALHAEQAGAEAVIIVQNSDALPGKAAANEDALKVTVPVYMVGREVGLRIVDAVRRDPTTATRVSLVDYNRFPEVQYWLDGGWRDAPDGTCQNDKAAAAAVWVVEAAKAAPHNPEVKRVERQLLACRNFTTNLDSFCVYDETDRLVGTVWSALLQPRLDDCLHVLADQMAAVNLAAFIKDELGTAAMQPHIQYHPKFPMGTPRAAVRQDTIMPVLASQLDWTDWASEPEATFIHLQLLLASAVDPLFADFLNMVVSDLSASEHVEVSVPHSKVGRPFCRLEPPPAGFSFQLQLGLAAHECPSWGQASL